MHQTVRVEVNGHSYEREVEPRRLLVHFLREDLELTGTNVGCETSLCGSCTVLVDGRAVKACTQLALQADGRSVTTIEGLAEQNGAGADQLHPLQEAFREHHGLQCGFCTPGMILAAEAFLRDHPSPDDDEIREALKGNVCRCTGYHNIVAAVRSVVTEQEA
ncbi:MAG: (2Fe-2S)-binding protein [Acidobacteriota bacterium]